MRNIRAILALAAVLSVAAAARADSIKLVNGLTYDEVTVTSVAEGVIVFRMPTGNALTKPVKELGVVSLDGMDAFNRAEAARAKGDLKAAADGYAEAAKGAAGWKKSLIRYRQLDVAEGAEQTGEAYGIWIELMDAATTPTAVQATLALRPKKPAAVNSPANNAAIALLEARLKVAKDAYLTGVRQALSELYERQGRMADATAMAELLAGNAPGPKPTDVQAPGGSAGAQLQLAGLSLKQGQFEKAASTVQPVLKSCSAAELPQALLILGRAQAGLAAAEKDAKAAQQLYTQAGLNLMRVAACYPAGEEAAQALVAAGEVSEKLGNANAARAAYERVMDEYKQSESVKKAEAALTALKAAKPSK